jgi:hypothetical protein
MSHCRPCAILLVATLAATGFGQAPRPPTPTSSPSSNLLMTVTDENGVIVPYAQVYLQSSPKTLPLRCETDFAGHCEFRNLVPGPWQLQVEKPGFYVISGETVQVGQVSTVDMTLSHLQEIKEVVNVVESPPAIDPQQVASTEQLTGLDVLNIPYPATHDYRNVLNFIPGVVQDPFGQPHIAGAETYQTLTLFDGFNVTQPANGLLLLRVSTDAIRLINAEDSRISAEYGKGSGGVLSITTGIGNDHFHFAATNFLPSIQFTKGLAFDSLVPRVTFSGPVRKGKIWFFEGLDVEFDNHVLRELPAGADTDHFWRIGNLAKLQANLTPTNILTASYLFNRQHDLHYGISVFSPPPTTPSNKETGDFATIKDQIFLPGGELLEYGFNFDEYGSDFVPAGTMPYVVTSQGIQGNYYLTSHTIARRWQALADLFFAPKQWHGHHELKAGIDLDRLAYNPIFQRAPISYGPSPCAVSPDGVPVVPSPCSRYSGFRPGPHTERHNAELSGYIQDRWSPTDHLLIEAGLRYDWDEIIRDSLLSPRLAATYILDAQAKTKLSAGIGIFYDPTNLVLVSHPFEGQRFDYFFNANGELIAGPIPMTFRVDQRTLQAPRFLNWSLALEHKLPVGIYLKAEFLRRHGTRGFVYNRPPGASALSGNYILENTREDHYDAFQISAHKAFRQNYLLTGSYTHSEARSNQVLDFNVDNPIYSSQLPGPYPWDAPNRFLSSGIFPIIKQFDLAYSAEARTGFPFYVVNKQRQLAELPGLHRFPTYFSLNLFLEKRFHLFGKYWAVRGGFNNITGRKNPLYVNNVSDSPEFLTFGGFTHRSFTTRIRLLSRK